MAQNADDRHPALAPSGMRADVCPICGGPNECGGAMGTHQCWCSTVKISPEALAAIPADARDRICVCPRCAQRPSHGIEDTADPGAEGEVSAGGFGPGTSCSVIFTG
jgi:hypothetical protein